MSVASEIIIENWNHLCEIVEKLPRNKWIFRGQQNATWPIDSTLYRLFKEKESNRKRRIISRKDTKTKFEMFLIQEFKRGCLSHNYYYIKNWSELDVLTMMQHYGAPTRLIDFTISPYIALFFAIERGDSDAAIFCINTHEFNNLDIDGLAEEEYGEDAVWKNQKGDKSFLLPLFPKVSNERLLAQQGVFVVPSNIYESFEKIVEAYIYNPDEQMFLKLVIPKSLRETFVQRLITLNITSSSLFPGFDGFCRGLSFSVYENIRNRINQ
jgi:hypothetical protein